jgi:hypothetical protein
MGWFFRKTLHVGKDVNINISKRGVGVSAGVKGARVSTGPSGTRVSGGWGPFRYVKTLHTRHPRKVKGTGYSFVTLALLAGGWLVLDKMGIHSVRQATDWLSRCGKSASTAATPAKNSAATPTPSATGGSQAFEQRTATSYGAPRPPTAPPPTSAYPPPSSYPPPASYPPSGGSYPPPASRPTYESASSRYDASRSAPLRVQPVADPGPAVARRPVVELPMRPPLPID